MIKLYCTIGDIIIERWIPYNVLANRKTIVQRAEEPKPYPKPRNVIIQYEAPQVRIVRQFQRLGVTPENPQEYVQRYGTSLYDSQTLVQQARAAGVIEDIVSHQHFVFVPYSCSLDFSRHQRILLVLEEHHQQRLITNMVVLRQVLKVLESVRQHLLIHQAMVVKQEVPNFQVLKPAKMEQPEVLVPHMKQVRIHHKVLVLVLVVVIAVHFMVMQVPRVIRVTTVAQMVVT